MPSSSRSHIFAHIVKKEDDFTELLVNYLRFEKFRSVFCNMLIKCLPVEWQNISFEAQHVTTQTSQEDMQRPDIQIFIPNRDCCIFIECKIGNAPLTPNQPEGYLRQLAQKGCRRVALFFLLPAAYQFEEDIIHDALSYFMNAKIDIPIRFIYWDRIIESIKSTEDLLNDPLIAEYLQCIEDRFSSRVAISQEEVVSMYDKNMGEQVSKLIRLVVGVGDELRNDYGIRPESNALGFGRYIVNSRGEDLLWFGLGYDFWGTKGSPLVYGVGGKEGGGAMSKEVVVRFRELCGGEWFV